MCSYNCSLVNTSVPFFVFVDSIDQCNDSFYIVYIGDHKFTSILIKK